MKTLFLTPCFLLLLPVFALSQGIHSTSPDTLDTHEWNYWGYTPIQHGAEILFEGWVEEWEAVDSFNFGFINFTSNWSMYDYRDSIIEASDILSDSNFSIRIPVDEEIPTTTTGYYPAFQTRVWYDTAASVFMTDSGWSTIGNALESPNDFFTMWTCTIIDAFADSIYYADTLLPNNAYIGEYLPGDTLDLGTGVYGILNNPESIQFKLSYTDTNGVTQEIYTADNNLLLSEKPPIEGIFHGKVYIPDSLPTASLNDIRSANFAQLTTILISNNELDTCELTLNIHLSETLADSLKIVLPYIDPYISNCHHPDDGECPGCHPGDELCMPIDSYHLNGYSTTFQVVTYPEDALSIVDYSVSDTSLGSIDSLGNFTPNFIMSSGDTTLTVYASTLPSGYSDSVTLTIRYYLNLEDNSKQATFQIHPNPAMDILFIDGINNGLASIYNSQGTLIKNITLTSPEIDISNLSSGSYILKIQNGQLLTTNRFIIL